LLHRYHVVALFLDPLQRPFVVEANVVPLASMVEAEATVYDLALEVARRMPLVEAPPTLVVPDTTPAGPPRRLVYHFARRQELVALVVAASHEELVTDELALYKSILPSLDGYEILSWWKGQTKLPLLQSVARSVLAIPASSAKSESNFSDGGNTVTKLRNRLKSSVVDDILFLRSTLKHS